MQNEKTEFLKELSELFNLTTKLISNDSTIQKPEILKSQIDLSLKNFKENADKILNMAKFKKRALKAKSEYESRDKLTKKIFKTMLNAKSKLNRISMSDKSNCQNIENLENKKKLMNCENSGSDSESIDSNPSTEKKVAFQKNLLINYNHNENFTSEDIQLYSCKISNYIQAPPGFSYQFVHPMSFDINYPDFDMISTQSNICYMYKNNRAYRKCEIPDLLFLDNNIEKQEVSLEFRNTSNLVAKGQVNLQLKGNDGAFVIYTEDSSMPNKFNPENQFEDRVKEIYINNNTVQKVMCYKRGFVDSPTVTYNIEIQEGEINDNMPQGDGMFRQQELVQGDYNCFNDYDLFDGESYSSVHNIGLDTPQQTPNQSSNWSYLNYE